MRMLKTHDKGLGGLEGLDTAPTLKSQSRPNTFTSLQLKGNHDKVIAIMQKVTVSSGKALVG